MIFIKKPGDEQLGILPELDDCGVLGGWTNECKTGDSIRMFASSGAKSYGYITRKGTAEQGALQGGEHGRVIK